MLSIFFRRITPALCLLLLLAAADNPKPRSPRSKGRPELPAPAQPNPTSPGQAQSGDAIDKKDKEDVPVRRANLSQAQFEKRVIDAGGRVDFVFGDDRPFAQCHASTLVETAGGQILCAWFGGTKEKDDDVAIWMARFASSMWSTPEKVAKVNDTAHWNPVLFRDPAKSSTYLFFKVGREIPFWETNWMETKDDGHTWSDPVELVAHDQGGRGPVKNKPIVMSDGTWLAGASTEYKGWKPFADRSQDGGRTWVRSADWEIDKTIIPGDGAIQPTVWESTPGNVHALLRTTGGYVGRTDSTDGGRTWTPLYLTDLPNNNSGLDVEKLSDGRLVLIYNPVGKNWGARSPLNLAISTDNGATWLDVAALEEEVGGEFSYPAIAPIKDGVAVSYTWKRQRVRLWQIPLKAL